MVEPVQDQVVSVEMVYVTEMRNLILAVHKIAGIVETGHVVSMKHLIVHKTAMVATEMMAVAHQIHHIVSQNFQIVMIQDLILAAVRMVENILIHAIV